MASSLDEFLAIEPEEEKIETYTVKMKNGKELDVDVKGLTLEQFKRVKKTSTNSYDNPNGQNAVAQIEEITLSQKLCALGIVDPPLSNVKLRKKFKARSNEELVGKLFPVKTIFTLGGYIMNLTFDDMDQDEEEIEVNVGTDPALIEEAKN